MDEFLLKLLCDEIDRLCEEYSFDSVAVEALEQVKFWAIEESIPSSI